MPSPIYVGTSGWSYPDWRGVVYPAEGVRPREELAFLAEFLDAVEVNTSFYRPPDPATVRGWLRRTASRPDFRFTCKLWQRFTHQREERFTREEVDLFRRGIAPLAEAGRLGALLVQFPWSFPLERDNLRWLSEVVEAFGEFPLVVEVRHRSWASGEGLDALRKLGVSLCNIDQPTSRNSLLPGTFITGPVGYVRLHGRNRQAWFDPQADRDQRYNYLYSEGELVEWADRIRELARGTERVYVFTNNHYRGQAPANALQLKAHLTGRRVPVPEPLLRTYPFLESIAQPHCPRGPRLF